MTGFDSLLEAVGEFGIYQKKMYFVLCLVASTTGIATVAVFQSTAEPLHRCAIPGYKNDTYSIHDDYHRYLINLTIPSTTTHGQVMYDPCNVFSSYGDNVSRGNWSGDGMETEITKCHRWVYDKTYYQSTAVSEMNLVCEKKSWRMHVSMAYMSGHLLGAIIMNFIADLYGRKKVLCLSLALERISFIIIAWAPEEISLTAGVFALGMSSNGVYTNAFVIGMEFTGPTKRYLTGTILDIFFALGECVSAGIGSLTGDRSIAISILTIPAVVFIPLIWFLPESSRWLVQKGQMREARNVIENMAKDNKQSLPEQITEALTETKPPEESLLMLLKSWGLAWRYMLVCFNWFSVSMLYYGLTMLSMDTIGNPYLNLTLFCLMEFPAYLCALILLKYVGRRVVTCLAMCLGGISCISTILPALYAGANKGEVILVLQLMGKFCAAISFTTIFTWTSELVPTVIRSRGIGVCSLFARLGGVIAPYIALLNLYIKGPVGVALPVVILGGVVIAAGLSNILLTETKDKPLPDNLADFNKVLSPKRHVGTTGADCHLPLRPM